MAKRKVKEAEAEVMEVDVEESSASLEEIFEQNRTLVIGAASVILLLIAGYFLYNWYQKGQNTEANKEMYQAIYYFEADSFNKALSGDGQAYGFFDIIDNYGGTPAADMANYYIGLIYLSADSPDVDLGIEYLEKVPGGDNMMAAGRDIALGFAYEDAGEPEKAASLFERAASTPGDNDQTTPYLLMQAGRAYEAAGKKSDALSVYERIKEDYPVSQEAQQIDKYIARVSQ
ncbi:MAG: tetratricopeptide repeat protein [Bacteroidota bacterium]